MSQGWTPKALQRKSRQKRQYEHAVQMMNALLRANFKITRTAQKMQWCIDDGLGRCLTIEFNMADGTRTIVEENDNG